jgi:electron transport complex protein RnfE
MMGLGFTLVLVLLGAMRELIGQGTLFTGMNLIFGEVALSWEVQVFADYPNFLFAILPPGAFVGMGIIIAIKNVIDQKTAESKAKKEAKKSTGSKRVRVTGKIA